MSRSTVVATLTAALLAVPTAALAHPALNPSSIPAGQAVDAVLVVPHGCAPGGGMPDMEEGAEAEATVELAVQQRDGVTLQPGEVDGWDVSDDGEAWVWTDAGGATTDVIELPVTITIEDGAETGDRFYLKAFQECAGGASFQWIGTPDEDAEYPAIFLEASDGEIGEAEPDEGTEMDHDGMDMSDDEMDMSDDDMDETEDMDMTDDEMEMSEDDMADDEMSDDDMAMDDAAAEDEGGVPAALILGLVILVAALAAGLFFRNRSAT